jgi:hypothetical protein
MSGWRAGVFADYDVIRHAEEDVDLDVLIATRRRRVNLMSVQR